MRIEIVVITLQQAEMVSFSGDAKHTMLEGFQVIHRERLEYSIHRFQPVLLIINRTQVARQ